jgi:serine/threonine protein kinase
MNPEKTELPQNNFELPDMTEYLEALQSKEIFKSEDTVQSRYKLGKTLGQGGFASVRRVTRLSDNEEFAMKVISYKSMRFTQKEMASMITEIGLL